MSCETCRLHKGEFSSESEYLRFKKNLALSVENDDLKKMDKKFVNEPFLKIQYSCNHCGASWLLLVPDQAFRGGWQEIL